MTGREALALAAGTLAVLRVTRLITTDDVSSPLRAALVRRFPPTEGARPVVILAYCQWCAGVWVALFAAAFLWATGMVSSWPVALVGWWAMAGASGLILERASG